MLTQPLSVLIGQIEASAAETDRLIRLRESRRQDPNYVGCDFCFDVGCGRIGMDLWVPCPEHNGLCA
jgi:hypothetical protein